MERSILPILCLAVLFGCQTEKAPEPTTVVGWFTPYYLAPEMINGQVKSLEQRAYWATEQNGEYIQGALITLQERDSIGWSDDFMVRFDTSGLALKVEYLDDDGTAYGYWKVDTRDGKYRKAEWIKGDTSMYYSEYIHDDAGQLVKMKQYRSSVDTLLGSADLEMDEQGNWIGTQWYEHNGKAGNSYRLVYNESGLVTSWESRDPEGNVRAWAEYTYDEDGRAVAGEGMGPDSTEYSYTAKYTDFDEKGNWEKMISFEDGELVGMDVRTIAYY
jgi:major membrane immunogen (membrane-anchored lipoprotein)